MPPTSLRRNTDIPVCSSSADEEAIRAELEERDDHHIGKNLFRVPAPARWKTSQDPGKLPAEPVASVCDRRTLKYRITSSPSHSSSASLGDLCAFAVNPSSMNMVTGGIDFDFGKEPADTFTRDQHPDLRADFVMANPPFNIKEWWDGKLEGDARWKYGTPPQGNANFAWVQHMLHHLAPNGSMALLLANGSMSSNSSGEGDIRRALIEADLVECMVRVSFKRPRNVLRAA